MYFKRFFIFLLVSFFLGYSYAQEVPENIKSTSDSIMKIKVEGFTTNNTDKVSVVHGTGFLTQDRNGQLRVVTNFHIIDSLKIIENIYAENNGNKFLLKPEAFSSLYDIAFLRVQNNEEHLGQALDLRKRQTPQPGERLYMLGFIGTEEHLTLIPMDFLFFSAQWADLNFSIDSPITHLDGISGSPIMDKNGRVVGFFIGSLEHDGFGKAANLLSYATNGDLIKCDQYSARSKKLCTFQARRSLFKKMQSDDPRIQIMAQGAIINFYQDNIDDFIQYIRAMEIDGETPDVGELFAIKQFLKEEEETKDTIRLLESCKKSILK